jgi:Predicted ATPase (AAA+ superfamily)
LPDAPYFNLLHAETFLRFSMRPGSLREELRAAKPEGPIIIDEIQKLPILLDEIQAMIDELSFRFILTGSSARKLKRSGTNLLGGRARVRHLHPLVTAEIGDLDLQRRLAYGSIPSVHLSEEPWEDLRSYCGTYLQQEIADEGLSRRIDAFARFFRVAAIMNGELLNFEALGSDSGVPSRTIREYYAILADTLVGELIEPWKRGTKRKAIATGRFWFFDIGVRNALAGDRIVAEGSERWGKNLEHLVYAELRAWIDYSLDDRSLAFWRTVDGREVDFVLGDDTAIEVKATERPVDRDLSGLVAIGEEGVFRRRILACCVPRPSVVQGVEVMNIASFIEELWAGRV